jgi:hypothetical protein
MTQPKQKKIEGLYQDAFKLALDPALIDILENIESKLNEIIERVNEG